MTNGANFKVLGDEFGRLSVDLRINHNEPMGGDDRASL